MKLQAEYIGFSLIMILVFGSYAQQDEFPILKGPYLGQKPPGNTPEIFAPGIVSTKNMAHCAPAFSHKGTEVFWYTLAPDDSQDQKSSIYFSEVKDGQWTEPKSLNLTEETIHDLYLSKDDQKLFCITSKFDPVNQKNFKYAHRFARSEKAWSLEESSKLKSPLKPGMPNYGNNETNGAYYIDADEDYIIFASYQPGGYGWMDLYISFKKPDGTWSKAQNMGGAINSKGNEDWPKVSPDGSYLFFIRSGNVYWVDLKIIEEFKMRSMP